MNKLWKLRVSGIPQTQSDEGRIVVGGVKATSHAGNTATGLLMTNDESKAFKKAIRDLAKKLNTSKAKSAEIQARIIANGVASVRRRSIPTLSQRDRRFLKTLRIVAW